MVILEAAAAAAKSLQSCPTLCDPVDGSPPGSPIPWDSPGKNTGVGCHFLFQCIKVKSESEVPQSCLTPSDPMDCSLPAPLSRGICQAIVPRGPSISASCPTVPLFHLCNPYKLYSKSQNVSENSTGMLSLGIEIEGALVRPYFGAF